MQAASPPWFLPGTPISDHWTTTWPNSELQKKGIPRSGLSENLGPPKGQKGEYLSNRAKSQQAVFCTWKSYPRTTLSVNWSKFWDDVFFLFGPEVQGQLTQKVAPIRGTFYFIDQSSLDSSVDPYIHVWGLLYSKLSYKAFYRPRPKLSATEGPVRRPVSQEWLDRLSWNFAWK